MKTKSIEPITPPRMVRYSCDASVCLYICMPANSSTHTVDDSRNDMPLDTATKNRQILVNSLRGLHVYVIEVLQNRQVLLRCGSQY